MTTIVAVRKDLQACIAADSLSCYGHIRETQKYKRSDDKIDRVGDTFIASAGEASLGLILRSYFRRPRIKASFGNCEEIFETFRRMHAVLKEDFYLNPHGDDEDSFECSQMELLIANPYGIFGVYAERSVTEYSRFYAMGSGRDLALGAMYAIYDRIESAEEIARIGVEAAAEFDDATGLPMTFEVIRLKAVRE